MFIMADIVALGCGLVGEYVITKLIEAKHNLTVVGLEIPNNLKDRCLTVVVDALEFVNNIQGNPLVINMLPGAIGNKVRETLLEKGLNVVDLAFTLEDPRKYASLAIKNNCSLVYDTGIAPGFSNLLVAEAINLLKNIEECKIRVGGIPAKPDQGWSYMAPFSPTDVIEEYERPARIIQGYKTVEFSALHDLHTINYAKLTNGKIGILQAFMTDGLRSLLDIGSCKNMSEYTLRWPGHIEKFIELQKKGMLESDKRAKTISNLVDLWKFDINRDEITLLDVNILSEEGNKRWIVYDEGNKEWSSMARTTGLVTLGFIDEMLNGKIPHGVFAPEELHGVEGLIQRITNKMKNENITIMELF